MSLTYAPSTGTTVNSHAVTETCINQTDQIGNNTVVVTDDFTTSNTGNTGDGTNGIGQSYVGRLIIINKGATNVQIRRCIAEAAIGTPTVANSWLLTVHEDWDTNPVATTDQLDVPYEMADIEDGDTSSGVTFTARTGYFTFTNNLVIASTGGLQMLDGTACELDDDTANATFIVNSGGYFYSGYKAGEEYINGGLALIVNNVTGEPIYDFQTGCHGYVYDMLFWSQLIDADAYHDGDMECYGTKWLNATNELTLYGQTLVDCKAYGKKATTSIVRVDANTVADGLVVSSVHALDSAADTTTETLTLSRVTFSNTTNILTVRQNKTWYLIDPNWSVTTYTDLDWNGTSTLCYVYDQRSIKATVQESDGTLLQNALVNVYENTILGDLVVEATTDVNGYAEDAFTYKYHATNSATTTYGGHALQAGKWLYLPFVSAQTSTSNFNGSIVLNPDTNIVQTTQATALTDGSGITWSEPTNPTELIDFTAGSGTLAVGMILTFSPSGAVGTLRESASGDSTAGELYLDTRNATAIGSTDTFSRTGGTAGTFSGTYTNGTKQPFSISINGNSKSQQTIHDYLAAKQLETTLSADGELIWEWCKSSQTKAFYSTGSSFYTERSNSKGIYIYARGAGTLDYLTDDAGTTWTPPASVTVQVEVLDDTTGLAIATTGRVYIADVATKTEILSSATNGSGIASTPYTYTTDVPIFGWAREWDLSGTDYVQKDFTGTITSTGFSQTIRLVPAT